jgi:tetratricopeptide (TPR) repeat protein
VSGVVLGLCLAAAAAAEAPATAPTPAASASAADAPVAAQGTLQPVGPPRPPPAGLDPSSVDVSDRDPVRAALLRAWSLPSQDLAERVRRTQRAGLALGLGNLEAPARALLLEPAFGAPLERARLAVELAPELPATHAALAAAYFDGWQLSPAWRAFRSALTAAEHQLEARLWLEATGSDVAFGAAFAGALGFLALAACAAFPRFARDLRALRELPGPSAGALAAALVLLPVALGEGLAGLGLGLASFALVNGSWWRRLWVMGAAALLVVSLHPLLERRAASHAALALDETALAAWAVEQGTPTASELARVLRHADDDPLASRALALRLARQGELALAEERFARLIERDDATPELLANAAAVRLSVGDLEGATELYEQAVASSDSPVLRFNLAQAYGRAIRFDEQELALAEAQTLDPDVLVGLNQRYNGQDGALVAFLPLSAGEVIERLSRSSATPHLASALRRPLAPGAVGAGRADAVVALGFALALGLLFGAGLRRIAGPEEDHYAGIARLLQARGGDSMSRMAQIEMLRARQRRNERLATLAAWLVPGAAGMVGGRPLLALLGTALFASGASLYWFREGAIADPLALGALPAALLGVGLGALGLAYLLVLSVAFALREKD